MFVQVGERRQWVEIKGEGSPTFILESGCGGSSADWEHIQQRLAQHSTVVAYDRAWSGRSEPSIRDRRASTMADELRELADAIPLQRPFILVGSSLGGLIVREYARRYRDDVCALLLVEPAHEDLELAMPAEYWNHEQAQLEAAAASSRETRPGFAAELEALGGAMRELRSVSDHRLGDLPLTVITAKKKWGDVPPHIDRAAVDRAWVELHERTVALSTAGRRVEAPASGHNVHRDDPELLVGEALTLFESCRR